MFTVTVSDDRGERKKERELKEGVISFFAYIRGPRPSWTWAQ